MSALDSSILAFLGYCGLRSEGVWPAVVFEGHRSLTDKTAEAAGDKLALATCTLIIFSPEYPLSLAYRAKMGSTAAQQQPTAGVVAVDASAFMPSSLHTEVGVYASLCLSGCTWSD